jgi:hypothetical protein
LFNILGEESGMRLRKKGLLPLGLAVLALWFAWPIFGQISKIWQAEEPVITITAYDCDKDSLCRVMGASMSESIIGSLGGKIGSLVTQSDEFRRSKELRRNAARAFGLRCPLDPKTNEVVCPSE